MRKIKTKSSYLVLSALIIAALFFNISPTNSTHAFTARISNVVGGATKDNLPGTDIAIDPFGTGIDSSGDVFIADSAFGRVRKLDTTTGIMTNVAGNGRCCSGGDDASAENAVFNAPIDVTFNSAGDMIISDLLSRTVRKVTNGKVSTIAGTGVIGFSGDGGPGNEAELFNPWGVAVDASDNVYIADLNNSRVRKVDAITGIITTVVGSGSFGLSGDTGPATSAAMRFPTDIAFDSTGNMYISDRLNNRIRKVDLGGTITSLAPHHWNRRSPWNRDRRFRQFIYFR